jgi:hypothetical protein
MSQICGQAFFWLAIVRACSLQTMAEIGDLTPAWRPARGATVGAIHAKYLMRSHANVLALTMKMQFRKNRKSGNQRNFS